MCVCRGDKIAGGIPDVVLEAKEGLKGQACGIWQISGKSSESRRLTGRFIYCLIFLFVSFLAGTVTSHLPLHVFIHLHFHNWLNNRSRRVWRFHFSSFFLLVVIPWWHDNRMCFRPLCVSRNAKILIGFGFHMVPIGEMRPLNFCFLHLRDMCFHLGLPCLCGSSTNPFLQEQWHSQSVAF